MIFGEYSPPSSPSLAQQRDALQKGLGRAMQWALAGRLDDEPLLEACLQDQRFDTQVESSRTDWLWAMIEAVGATKRFRVPILHALYDLSEERSANQLCELARYYAVTGDETFRARLYEIVEQKPFAHYPSLGEAEISALDGEPAFLFTAMVRGRALLSREAEWDEWDEGTIINLAIERFGQERIQELLEASSDPAVRRFREHWQQARQGKAVGSLRDAYIKRMTAIPIEEIIRAAESDEECYWFHGWGRYAGKADLLAILERLWVAREPRVIVKLFRIFSRRALPQFDARLFEICRHADVKVRRLAFHALGQNTHPLIREFALTELARGTRNRFVVDLFFNNYRPGDEQRILELIEFPDDTCELHWLLKGIIKVLEKNTEADCSQLGLISYASTPCENCRCDAAKLLLNQHIAPDWLKEEYRHDSSEECRELVSTTGPTERN